MKTWIRSFMADKSRDGTRFRAGVLLIIVSFPAGFAAPLVAGVLNAATNHWFAVASGIATYAFSWVLFLMGVWLAGHKGLMMVKQLWHVIRNHKKDPLPH